jgi:phospholipid/cholesterol/gamma-HCH transport system substrate-binding protein
MILLGVGVFVAVGMWLRGLHPGNRTFSTVIEFATIGGVQSGSPVRYRGVTVGRIVSIQPGPNGVEVHVDISPADLIIPRDSEVSVNQSGLLGESVLDFFPRKSLPDGAVSAKPLDRDCNKDLIVCDGSRLKGQIGISTDELLRASIKFADLYGDPAFFEKVNTLTKNSSAAAAEVAQLSREFSSLAKATKGELATLSSTAKSIGNTADQVGLTMVQVNSLIAANRSTLVSTLNNLDQTSVQLRSSVTRLSPVIDQVAQGELIRNLETLSSNAAQASANLRDVSTALNSPTNLVVLQQTLDSARATFQNAQKITADMDELTGDPALRDSLRNLIKGLSGLVSSTQQLQQQAQVAQVLAPIVPPSNSGQIPPRQEINRNTSLSPAPAVQPSPVPVGVMPSE